MVGETEPVCTVRNLSKRFGAIHALSDVDLTVYPGQVHALVGENGAGKSTLMKILSGACQPDTGDITVFGVPYRPRSCVEARRKGIAMIYQELTLAPHLTVAENVMLGMERSRWGFAVDDREKIRGILADLGHAAIDLDAQVRHLSISARQVVEIARALMSNARLVIMDEPTSSLSSADAKALFRAVGRLAASGMAVIYISHFLEEVRQIADRYTVLRDGHTVATGAVRDIALRTLVEKMVGRQLDEMFPRVPHTPGSTLLSVTNLTTPGGPRDAGLNVRKGEIFGIAGLVGSGRSETMRALFGLQSGRQGRATIKQSTIRIADLTPRGALRKGLDLLSENRKDEGLATQRGTRFNTCLSTLPRLATAGFVSADRERRQTRYWCDRLAIKCPDVDAPVASLSGGNQQKVALARILLHDSDVLLLDEPTRGIDVGSKAEICRLIGELAADGKAIIMVSSYLPELLGICDRVAVMHRGILSPAKPADEWTEERLMHYATTGRMN